MYVPISSVLFQICIYCGAYKGAINGYGVSGVSHGICIACSAKEIAAWQKEKAHDGTGKDGLQRR